MALEAVILSLCAHVGAFRGPLGKLGVMGGVWGLFSACLLRETLKRDNPRILLGPLLAFFRFVLAGPDWDFVLFVGVKREGGFAASMFGFFFFFGGCTPKKFSPCRDWLGRLLGTYGDSPCFGRGRSRLGESHRLSTCFASALSGCWRSTRTCWWPIEGVDSRV